MVNRLGSVWEQGTLCSDASPESALVTKQSAAQGLPEPEGMST